LKALVFEMNETKFQQILSNCVDGIDDFLKKFDPQNERLRESSEESDINIEDRENNIDTHRSYIKNMGK